MNAKEIQEYKKYLEYTFERAGAIHGTEYLVKELLGFIKHLERKAYARGCNEKKILKPYDYDFESILCVLRTNNDKRIKKIVKDEIKKTQSLNIMRPEPDPNTPLASVPRPGSIFIP